MTCTAPHPACACWLTAALVTCAGASAQSSETTSLPSVEDAIGRGVERLLEMQEGENCAEWPYEGVYRVRDEETGQSIIPIGYRVGGTSVCALAIMQSPGYEENPEAQAAVERAAQFVIGSIEHPLMRFDHIPGTYDVRGWGYAYGVLFLIPFREHAAGSNDVLRAMIDESVGYFVDGIQATEIPQSGGWNYSRRGGFDQQGDMSPFMTAPTVQALLLAKRHGFEVDGAVIERGLDALEGARLVSGAFVYAGEADGGRNARSQVPGAAARMAAAEAALFAGGRSSIANVRAAVDAFIVHWEWLDQRRAQTGTHIGPYGIAPYYFYYGHYYAAEAVELLPEQDRPEYRRRLRGLLFRNRLEDGTWNDRIFERSANFGTAMAVMSLRGE